MHKWYLSPLIGSLCRATLAGVLITGATVPAVARGSGHAVAAPAEVDTWELKHPGASSKIGKEAQRLMKLNFSWEQHIKNLEDIFVKILM